MDLTQQLQHAGNYLMKYDLAWGNSGNISARVDQNSYLVTASGTFMGELQADDFVQVGLNNIHYPATKKPTKETPMHTAVYEARPDIGAVLHSSPFYSTLFACTSEPLEANYFIESMYYLQRIAYVDYHEPGSQSLGDEVREKAQQANILFLKNHGVLVFDSTLNEARMALQTLELTCRMVATSKASHLDLKAIGEADVTRFLEGGVYKPKRVWGK
ncbi:class II aldolase/adducin family protein [Chryseomicrobium palamuruense]|uniref:Class II aldolase/adducin family protein n=1 Tax=Chryseomicrobium palamuruense TaxID=682973 RepID=A0ABV8USK7_9BACL